MLDAPNFRPKVFEPLLPSGESGFGIEIEFHEDVRGLNGDTIMIYLNEKTSIADAKKIVDLLDQFGTMVKISNPK